MDHFPRFRRKKGTAMPAITTTLSADDTDLTSTKTTTPSSSPSELHPPAQPGRHSNKLSPFRAAFRRASGKRARDSPPASLPYSPMAVATHTDGTPELHPISPLSPLFADAGGAHWEAAAADKRRVKIPQFLQLSQQEIQAKFAEVQWLERERQQQARLNPSPEFKWARASGPHLRALDRYGNIQPWNNNRVKLRVPDGYVDYINASPIMLAPTSRNPNREPHRYIAMQGPKSTSTGHAWRMVVEQLASPGVIVMLTETHEGTFEKCYQYFPRSVDDPPVQINEHDEFGDGFRASVHCEAIEETSAGDAIELRKLVVRVHEHAKSAEAVNGDRDVTPISGGRSTGAATPEPPQNGEDEDIRMKSPVIASQEQSTHVSSESSNNSTPDTPAEGGEPAATDLDVVEERIVWHFLYKKWPDFGVPALEDIDSFFTLMQLSREKNAGPHNPRIVHCSAGVGRSGTFIALEHLMRELDAGVLENYDDQPVSPSVADGGEAVGEPSRTPQQTNLEAGGDLIFDTVNKLREQRTTMVQAEAQYLFVYQVMRKLWQDKYGSDEEPNLGVQDIIMQEEFGSGWVLLPSRPEDV